MINSASQRKNFGLQVIFLKIKLETEETVLDFKIEGNLTERLKAVIKLSFQATSLRAEKQRNYYLLLSLA